MGSNICDLLSAPLGMKIFAYAQWRSQEFRSKGARLKNKIESKKSI